MYVLNSYVNNVNNACTFACTMLVLFFNKIQVIFSLFFFRVSNFLSYPHFTHSLFKMEKKELTPRQQLCLSVVEICFPQRHVKFPGSALSNFLVYPRITFVVITNALLREIRNYSLRARAGDGSSPGPAVDRQDRRWAPESQDVGDTCCLPGRIVLPTR